MTALIFISYRRDDLQGHARALHEFLSPRFAPGAIFFDRDDSSIVGGDDFRLRITDALNGAEVVLVLIGHGWLNATDKQGRQRLSQPDDVVRFEIETALRAGKFVLPVLFDGYPMPDAQALPAGLSGLTARHAVTLGGKATDFQRGREHLCNLIEQHPGLCSASRRQMLRSPSERRLQDIQRHYLGRDNYRPAFVGRESVLGELDDWLEDPSSRRLLLVGAAAIGKSSLLLNWLQDPFGRKGDWTIVYVPISVRFNTNTPELFWSMLANRLAPLTEMIVDASREQAAEGHQDLALDALDLLEREGRKLLLVIDGLDEAGGWEIDQNLLATRGASLRWLISARAVGIDTPATDRWLQLLGWSRGRSLRLLELQPLSREAVVEAILLRASRSEGTQAIALADDLWRVSAGDPMLLGYYLDDIADSGTINMASAREALTGVGPGFASYFNGWLDRQRPYWNDRDGRSLVLDGLLALLACAHGPLGIAAVEELLALAYGLAEPLSASLLRRLRRFVLDTAEGLVLAHPRMTLHIQQEFPADGDRMTRARKAFLAWGQQVEVSSHARRYLARHFAQHLADPQNGATLAQLKQLTRAEWVRLSLSEDDSGRLLSLDLDLAERALQVHTLPAALDIAHRWAILVMRYSVRTRARVEPELLAAYVLHGLLAGRQAVRRLELMNPLERTLGYALLASQLPPTERTDLLGHAIASAPAIVSFSDRAAAWGQVLLAVSDADQREAVETAVMEDLNQAGSMYHWLQAVDWIAPGLSPIAQRHLLHWSFQQVGRSQEPGGDWNRLDAFMPHIHDALRDEAVLLAMRRSAELDHRLLAGDDKSGRCDAIADAALPYVFFCLTPREQEASWHRAWEQMQASQYDSVRLIGLALALPWLGAQGREDEARKTLATFSSRSGDYVTAETLIRFARMSSPSVLASVARERAVATMLKMSNGSSKRRIVGAAAGILDESSVEQCFRSLMATPPPGRWSLVAALSSRLTQSQLEEVRAGQTEIGDSVAAHRAVLALRAQDLSASNRPFIAAAVSALRASCGSNYRPETLSLVLRKVDPSRWEEIFGVDLPWLAGGEDELLLARPTSTQADELWAAIQRSRSRGTQVFATLEHRRLLKGVMPEEALTDAVGALIDDGQYLEVVTVLDEMPIESARPLRTKIAERITKEVKTHIRAFPTACLLAAQGPVEERPRWRAWVDEAARDNELGIEYRVWQLKLRSAQERASELEAIRQACLSDEHFHGKNGLKELVHELSVAEAERFVEPWLRLAEHQRKEEPTWLSMQGDLPEPLARATLAALDRLIGDIHRTDMLHLFTVWAPEISRFLGPAGLAVLAEGIDAAREGFA